MDYVIGLVSTVVYMLIDQSNRIQKQLSISSPVGHFRWTFRRKTSTNSCVGCQSAFQKFAKWISHYWWFNYIGSNFITPIATKTHPWCACFVFCFSFWCNWWTNCKCFGKRMFILITFLVPLWRWPFRNRVASIRTIRWETYIFEKSMKIWVKNPFSFFLDDKFVFWRLILFVQHSSTLIEQ